jgi:hypothetical protein
MVNKSATLIGTVVFSNGSRTSLWIGTNSNTGETIVWNKLLGGKGRATRTTGSNITKLANELNAALNAEGARWDGDRNDAALDALAAFASA